MNVHKITRFITLILLLVALQKANAQTDFPMSLVTSAPMQLNPATTGLFDDRYRIHMHFKSQTARVIAGGISGTGISVDYNHEENKMGFGVSIFSNSVNRTALRDFNLTLSYGYRLQLNDWSLLSFGVQGGFKQVGFSLEELSFGSQFDPTYQGGFDPNRRPDFLISSNKVSLDASVGTFWQAFLGTSILLKTGASAFNLIPVRTDFLNEDTYLRPKYVFSLEARYGGDPFHFIPSVMHVTQSEHTYTEMGLSTEFRDGGNFASIGLYYRTPNVIIPTIGFGMNKFTINLSIEYYLRNNFSQIFNISLLYRP